MQKLKDIYYQSGAWKKYNWYQFLAALVDMKT